MQDLYPEIDPHAQGSLDVGDGNHVHWESCGNPSGKPAVVLHGGPGSGCSPMFRRFFDPQLYRIVLFDQRNCGLSTPHASAPEVSLAANNTANLIADIELLRKHLRIDRWLVLGGSWGSTLALAYAESHPERVTEMVLFGVTSGRHSEFDWTFRGGIAAFFPDEWNRLRNALLASDRDADVVEACDRLLKSPDEAVRRRAADAWCLWESATPKWPPATGLAKRFTDPDYAMAFARIVTHYVLHNAWLEDGVLLRQIGLLSNIPAILINGRFDFQAPIGNAWELARVWAQAELVIVDDAGHSANQAISQELVRAT